MQILNARNNAGVVAAIGISSRKRLHRYTPQSEWGDRRRTRSLHNSNTSFNTHRIDTTRESRDGGEMCALAVDEAPAAVQEDRAEPELEGKLQQGELQRQRRVVLT